MALPNGGSANNAIDAIAFVLHFHTAFDEKLLEKLEQTLFESSHYPKFDHSQLQQIQVKNGVPHVHQEKTMSLPFWQKYRDDGRVVHELRCERQSLVYYCSDYTRWHEVQPRAVTDLKRLMEEVAPTNTLTKLSLQTTDKFKLDKNESAFDALFNLQNKYLTENLTQTESPFWHVHQGWFENMNKGRCLNVLNINLAGGDDNSKEVVIDHISDISLSAPADGVDIDIKSLFNQAHLFNKNILNNLLQDKIKKEIGLK